MRTNQLLSALALLIAVAGCRTRGPVGDAVRGPLPTRLQHPLALTELAFRSRRPVAQSPGSTGAALQLSYSSIFTSNGDEQGNFAFDGETARATLRLRHGLGAGLDVEAELPVSFSSGGFLDGFVQSFHAFLGLPDPRREHAVDNVHDMVLREGADDVWRQEPDRIGLGDLPLFLAWSGGASGSAASPAWRYGVRAGLELPTGSEQDGLGNGGVDWGAALSAERSQGRWTHHLAAWWARVAQPEGFEASSLELADAWQAEYALELRAFPSVSWIAQLQLRAPLVRGLDLEGLREPVLELALGVVGDAAWGARWFVSFHEDLISRAGPDFALALGMTWNL